MGQGRGLPLLAIVVLGLGGCAEKERRERGMDAGRDAGDGRDAGPDAGRFDAGRDEPDAGQDAGGEDAGADGGVEGPTVIDLVNTGADDVFLEGSYNMDCGPPYYELQEADSGQVLVDRLPFLACNCDGCASPGCKGMADSGPAYLVIPAGGSAQVTWAGGHFEGAEGCQGGGCLEFHPVGDGPYRLIARYRRGSLECPTGGAALPADISGPPGDGTLMVCELNDFVRCFDNTDALDQVAEVTFRRSDGAVRVELP